MLQAPGRVRLLGRAFRALGRVATRARPTLSRKLANLVEYGRTYPGAYLLRRGLFIACELLDVLPADVVEAGLRALEPFAHIEARMLPDPHLPYARVAALEASLYMRNQLLRDTDWASMAWSLEVRVPLVDSVLLSSVAPMLVGSAPGAGKRALARVPQSPLPDVVARRKKTGFTTPIARWLADSPLLSRWREVPALKRDGCHWSRRLAYELVTAEK